MTSIPEGHVFIPRRSGENVSRLLLEAAEEIGADRVLSVRSTTNGYNVHRDVAEKYIENVGADVAGAVDGPEVAERAHVEPTTENVLGALASWGDQDDESEVEEELDDDEELEEEEEESTGNGDQTPAPGDQSEPEPLGVTAQNTNAEIDAYAANLTPPVDVSKAANKVEKIEILEHARTAPKTDPAA